MITLSPVDFTLLLVINLIVHYLVNFAKKKGELHAEEGKDDKEYLKTVLRDSITETRTVLTELKVHEFSVRTGRRKLSRMNDLVEKLNIFDSDLGQKVWGLVNAPILLATVKDVYKDMPGDSKVNEYLTDLHKGYFSDVEWALSRLIELERSPTKKIARNAS